MKHKQNETDTLFLKAGEGRSYQCGNMSAIFKADENETAQKYSIPEWHLEPNTDGPGAHLHEENDEIFYGIAGKMWILVGSEWLELEKGDFLRIPANIIHDFANRTSQKAAVLNFFIPGVFERNMPAIVQWFEDKQ